MLFINVTLSDPSDGQVSDLCLLSTGGFSQGFIASLCEDERPADLGGCPPSSSDFWGEMLGLAAGMSS